MTRVRQWQTRLGGLVAKREAPATLVDVRRAEIDGGGGSVGSVAWADVSGKPTFGTASAQDIGYFAAAVHTHSIANVTGLQTALDGKQAAGSYAAASHTHATSEVTGLDAALSGKQASLVSGTNIKTVNGVTLLGSGDLVISGGGSPLMGWFI
jgi:hypothetical protein